MKKFNNILIFSLLVILALIGCEGSGYKQEVVPIDGMGGSTARFAVVGKWLFTIRGQQITTYDVTDPENPILVNDEFIAQGIETVFPFKGNLFIGSSMGMFAYEIGINGTLLYRGQITHMESCDPVVVNDTHAFVTLRDGSTCRRNKINELQVIQLNNLTDMKLIDVYPMSNPRGLGVWKDRLFVCDAGLKVYDISDIENLKLLETYAIKAEDVIPFNKSLLVVGDDGFYQYEFVDSKLNLLSFIPILKK